MPILNMQTLQILALSKILFFIFVIAISLLFFIKKLKPWILSIIFATIIPAFYAVMSAPLQKMFWGNNGDEVFIISFFSKILNGNMFHDFYYDFLPQFYPPLYFWTVGLLSKPFTSNGIFAAKLGVLLTLIAWFIIPIIIFYLFIKNRNNNSEHEITNSAWFYTIYPIVFFLMLDFESIITKPYETISALLCIIFVGIFFDNIYKSWKIKNYIIFGILGATLFMTYYFWWFVLFPTIFVLSIIASKKIKGLIKPIILCSIIVILSSVYLVPLILSFFKYGIENWQAVFFVPGNLSTFTPWSIISLKTPIFLFGVFGLIMFYKKSSFIKSSAITLLICYVYQFLNIIYLAFGNKPPQPSKPFLFLGGATMAVGFSYFIIYLITKIKEKHNSKEIKIFIVLISLIALPLLPFNKFIEDPVVLNQLKSDLETPPEKALAMTIKNNVPNWSNYTWLSSGAPEINAYLPLNYYIAHNPHFSHQASNYSKRLKIVENLTQAKDSSEFYQITSQEKINALLFYKSENYYNFFYWADDYPNGGKNAQLKIPENLVDEKFWTKVYDNGGWYIYLIK